MGATHFPSSALSFSVKSSRGAPSASQVHLGPRSFFFARPRFGRRAHPDAQSSLPPLRKCSEVEAVSGHRSRITRC